MPAEFFCPPFELSRPLFLVFFEVVFAIEQDFELVVVIVCVPEDAAECQVEIVQVMEKVTVAELCVRAKKLATEPASALDYMI